MCFKTTHPHCGDHLLQRQPPSRKGKVTTELLQPTKPFQSGLYNKRGDQTLSLSLAHDSLPSLTLSWFGFPSKAHCTPTGSMTYPSNPTVLLRGVLQHQPPKDGHPGLAITSNRPPTHSYKECPVLFRIPLPRVRQQKKLRGLSSSFSQLPSLTPSPLPGLLVTPAQALLTSPNL